MNAPKIQPLLRPFDPLSNEAEEQYDAVVHRLTRVRAERQSVDARLHELERQFIEGDLTVRTGSKRGEPLSRTGRKRRLDRLIELGIESRRLSEVERFSSAALEHMNEALDRWAKETYGP